MIRMIGRMHSQPRTQFRRKLRTCWAVLALMLAVTSALRAQVLYGVLVGNLTDTTGAGVVGAKIIASNQATGIAVSVNSDAAGHFMLNNVAPGTYTQTVTAASFKKVESQGIA
ncbi:MAG: carboxypeptidase-like regulatory domain-containing protein, partial [Formivibrio sp.]|nr:carboxypeptidase-like regulatory domain-containing protein [Formivibrio sp.]